ncbi:MAG: hypothetical protein WCO56_24105 [Verrucomicrobiota bacterium]
MLNQPPTTPPDTFKFKPGKTVSSDYTNGERASVAVESLMVHPDAPGSLANGDYETPLVDTLANLFHLCDREGISVESVLASATRHWQSER